MRHFTIHLNIDLWTGAGRSTAMTSFKKIILIWVVIIVLVIVLFGQGNTETGKIIENYLNACGGSALAEVKTEIRKGTMLRGVSGKIPVEIIAKSPGKWRFHLTFAWGDRVCYGFDGATAWVQDTKSVSPMNPWQRLDLQLMLDIQAPLNIQKYYPVMTIEGSEEVSGREAVTVMATAQDGTSTELAFDNETGLLVRAGDIFFEDYREIGRVKRPYRILLGRDEGEEHLQMKIQFSEIQHNLEVDDSQFQQPVCLLPYKEPPLYTQRNQVEVSIEALNACVGEYQIPELPDVIYTVTRQENHLMLERTGWGQKFEIKPESEDDYFIQFLNWEFHFIKDASGKVTHLEIKADQRLKAKKIK
jgi:outer membrane lipoprotein-sorting protein